MNMSRLVPTGFLTIPQAAERLAVAIFAGMPDRPLVTNLRESGFDVADGAAIDDAVSKIWAAVDRRKAQAFVVGARQQAPLKLSSEMSKGIPGLR
ncbi:MAG: hypothetical protein WBL84_12160, partial [Xanthobacteraceae bacterium]